VTQPVPGVRNASPAEALTRLGRLAADRQRELRRPLTDEELTTLEEQQPCMHCGGHHSRSCPRVKRIAWHPQGKLAEVEYWPSQDVDWDAVVFEDQGDDGPPPTLDDLLQALIQAHPGNTPVIDTAERLRHLLNALDAGQRAAVQSDHGAET
jgi:hypothetical protein